MKRVLGVLLIGVVFASPSFAKVLESIDAIVNNELILSGELDYRILDKAKQLDKIIVENGVMSLPNSVYQELRPQVLEQMIDELLLFQAVRGTLKESELTYLREDALRKTDLRMEQFQKKIGTVENLSQEESLRNMTWEEIRQGMYQQIYNDNIRRVIINQIINRRVERPTQAEIDDYNAKNAANPPTGDITVQQLLLNLPSGASEAEERKVFQKAQEALVRARGGESFDYLVYIYSEHNASRQEGGLLPPFKKGTTLKEFEPIFDLNIGEISEPIRTPSGYHIFRVVYKDTAEARVFELKKRKEINDWLTELRAKAKIVRKESKGPSPILPRIKQ